jgi:acyl carrier protein
VNNAENNADIRAATLAAIKAVAPEVEEGALAADRPLREQVDLDSMDWLNVIVGLHERLGVEIPEADYAKLTSLNAIVAYLAVKR